MRPLLFGAFMFVGYWVFGQEKKLQFKDYFNEFYASANHGLPIGRSDNTYFGGGLGISHVFRADSFVGTRLGLELDFFHFWDKGGFDHILEKTIENKQCYLTSLSLPVNLRFSFGQKKLFFIELGGRLGFNLYSYYWADVAHSDSNYNTYFTHEKNLGGPVGVAFGGVNSGIGYKIPFSEKIDFIIRPTFQVNIYDLDWFHFYSQLNIGIQLK